MSGFQKIKDFKRFEQVISVLTKHEVGYLLKKKFHSKNSDALNEPIVLRQIIEELGGTFVKLGQFLSLRPDLIPIKYCEELSKLQDQMKPYPFADAKKLIEKAFDSDIKKIFSSFNKKPVACASIGQVYKAKLKTGLSVAIKVKRPGIDSLINTDLEILELIASEIKKISKYQVADPQGIISELKEYTLRELNYLHEAGKIEKFYESFKDTSIKIPLPISKFCTQDVLVMEFVEGEKLIDYMDKKVSITRRKEIVDEIVNAFFKQVFVDGFFHADPHPGNILVLKETEKSNKKIAFLDFGITGEITDEIKQSLLNLFLAMFDKDLEKIITAMGDLHLIDSESPELRSDMREMLGPYYGLSLRQINVPKLFAQSLKVAKKHNVKVPRDYVLLGKSLITLESVCTILYPEFNMVESAKPFVTHMVLNRYSPKEFVSKSVHKILTAKNELELVPHMIKQYFDNSKNQQMELKELSSHLNELETHINKTQDRMVIVASALILLFGGIIMNDVPPFIAGFPAITSLLIIISIGLFIYSARKK